ncbi:periplasmic protein containing Sel1/Tetratricope ptide repeat domain [Sulfurimonas gotlandica GD1]|uniref:beta-lactamase n=1 Tax=Sulfurimonas gotlandica (strain DSM 19862 / JCM 16533 / GD1) TaxID=929558 RepID=B6BHL5_SULGG|nr:tetratricopeptide repeat protein [Sulfurimonas gotlandica]EDZ62810.1 Sel1 domain protein repeat-containing protein [Sulfurimonas gotlandica GD1]EHP30013.1 periplasmic protein containing Sel1/Tetratricope ptide repeat domain [Sulfurimonas gotlandica GD1]
MKIYLLILGIFFSLTLHADNMQEANLAYDNGNYKKAYELWLPYAEKREIRAMHNIGTMSLKGQGITANDYEAFKWYSMAAEAGLAESQYALGLLYKSGEGTNKDLSEAFRLFYKAAKQDVIEAQVELAIMYNDGYYFNEGFKLLKKAADQGSAKAQYKLTMSYCFGLGTDKNLKEALFWAEQTKDSGLFSQEIIDKLWKTCKL